MRLNIPHQSIELLSSLRFPARFAIRGGLDDETLVNLDGLELSQASRPGGRFDRWASHVNASIDDVIAGRNTPSLRGTSRSSRLRGTRVRRG